MKFGDKEWFEKLEKMVSFPSVFAFYVTNEKQDIHSKLVETKAERLGNIQYKMLEPPLLTTGENNALASVIKCKTPQEYYQECKRLKAIWNENQRFREALEEISELSSQYSSLIAQKALKGETNEPK